VMIGGPTDVVVEPNIVRTATPVRETASARPVAAATDTLPRAVPLSEGSSWPLQPDVGRTEPAARPEPLSPPIRPQRNIPAADEQAQWPAADAEQPPPLPTPRERRPRPDPLSGLAEELARGPAPREQQNSEPAPRQPVRREARPRPASAVPPSTPSIRPTDGRLPSTADQNLAEMAQRLEAALRRPARNEQARPVEVEPNEEATPAQGQEFTPAPSAPAGAEPPKSQRSEGNPPRGGEPKPQQQKSLYDSLEQEMASLLGRPNNKS
jgi:hypothetical protein